MPSKGDIIINPRTQRPVKVGGRTWLKLVKEGALAGQYRDPSVLRETYTDEDLDDAKTELNSTLPSHKQAVKGRGKHKGKIVVRNKRLAQKDLTQFASKASASALARNMDELENLDDDELERRLEELILSEMMGVQSPRKRPAPSARKRPNLTPRANNLSDSMYVLEDDQQTTSGALRACNAPEWDDDDSEYDPQVDGFDDDVYDTSLSW